jgi:arylsulfatase A-like enzyme
VSDSRPNIILFMIDTFRPDRLEPWGLPDRPTPAFKRLADEGVFFRNLFAHMPSSHPSRASILTGRDPHTCGMRINCLPLPEAEITLTELLRDSGYLTAATRRDAFPPGLERGFIENGLSDDAFAPDAEGRVARPWEVAAEIPECSDQEAASEIAQDVATLIDWLKKYRADSDRNGRPFFLWADVEDVHGAWRPPPPFDTMYAAADWDGPDMAGPANHSPGMPVSHKERAIDLYDGMVAFVDKYIGILTDAIDDLGFAENTLLVVMSDHAASLGEHNMWGKMCTVFDPVLRSVLVMRQKGVLPPKVQTDGLALMNDVFATLAEHAGVEVPDAAKPHCASLKPLWNNVKQVREQIPMEFNLYSDTAIKAIRTEKWKYIYHHKLGNNLWCGTTPAAIFEAEGWKPTMLFDLVNDPGETTNVIDDHPAVADDMRRRLIDWLIDSENDVPAILPKD